MRQILLVVALVTMASTPSSARAEGTPQRSAELQVLDRFIGDWETVVTNKATGDKVNSIQSRKWSREGKFVLSEEQNVETKRESHFLMTYDAKAKRYRACFMNEEFITPLLGTWDETTQTMTWQSTDIPFKHEGVNRYIDKDHFEWTMTIKSPEGKVVLELSARQTRRNK